MRAIFAPEEKIIAERRYGLLLLVHKQSSGIQFQMR
jgi:hypothetical protein